MRYLLLCICLTACATSAVAENRITYYRDGTLYRSDERARKGLISVPLATGILDGSLTVTPGTGTTIITVESVTVPADSGSSEVLNEQRSRLQDRLQALETREAIFTAAAKAQSGKAPRKTKTNPDPLQAIRQGTDFAIAQLEAVYTARRRTTQELARLEARITAARSAAGVHSSQQTLRINVIPANGSVTVRYATAERGWQPHYNLRIAADGSAVAELVAREQGIARGYQTAVSTASLYDRSMMAGDKPQTATNRHSMRLSGEQASEGLISHFSGLLTNSSSSYLPPGEMSVFHRGTYKGKFIFAGLSSGRSSSISLGQGRR